MGSTGALGPAPLPSKGSVMLPQTLQVTGSLLEVAFPTAALLPGVVVEAKAQSALLRSQEGAWKIPLVDLGTRKLCPGKWKSVPSRAKHGL